MSKVAVVGAGVIGVTSALVLKEAVPELDVTIVSERFTPDTTGDGSAGLWGPYAIDGTSERDVLSSVYVFPPREYSRWSGITHRWMEALWRSGLAPEAGVSLLPVIRATSDPAGYPEPFFARLVYGARRLSAEDLRRLSADREANYSDGWHYLTYTCEPTRLLPWLMDKFESLGGHIRKGKVESLDELTAEGYRIVVNCSGLGARELLKDSAVTPVRGQVTRVDASWAFCSFMIDDEGLYVIPNIDSVILGGTKQKGDFDLAVRESDTNRIHEGCHRIWPSLKHSKIKKQWVGLRPGRSQVRLDSEIIRAKNGLECLVIHNYGHGGSGVTLSWGCAMDVLKIVKNSRDHINRSSKL